MRAAMMMGVAMGSAALVDGRLTAQDAFPSRIVPLLETYCFDCHAEGAKKGGFSFDEIAEGDWSRMDRKHWLDVWHNLRSGIMPPYDEDQPGPAEHAEILRWIESTVLQLDPNNPDPGRVTIRRLNRSEYRNAVKDMLGVDFDTTEEFPADDTGYGFDNIGDVLSISPLLMEKYVAAADVIARKALPEGGTTRLPLREIAGSVFKSRSPGGPSSRWIPFSGTSRFETTWTPEWQGEFDVALDYASRGANEATEHRAKIELWIDGRMIASESLGWDQRKTARLAGRAKLGRQPHKIEIRLSQENPPAGDEEELFLTIQRVVFTGPRGGKVLEELPSHRIIFGNEAPPDDQTARGEAAGRIMDRFVSRAFRRPLDAGTRKRLLEIVRMVDAEPNKTFEDGIREAIAACLCSPRFLFRIEIQPEPDNRNKIVPLDEYALAARLSFFLWNSVPDDELLSLAFRKQLRENLHPQVDRMLADPRSRRMITSFVGQWLQIRDLETLPVQAAEILGQPSRRDASRLFSPVLREDMMREAELLFEFALRQGRPAEELISARYSFLNERLASYYGVEGPKGEAMQAVDLTEHPERGGLLAQAGFLIVTSNPTRTSPVKRGLFVLDNLLDTPAPGAPPDVPPLEAAAKDKGPMTMREMMEEHRRNPDCRGCHQRMDPIGLGLEHYDALGRYRATEQGKPIDTAGRLITGEPFSDVAELKRVLADQRRDDFYRCLAGKFLTYALGRGMEFYDAVTIDQLVSRMKSRDGSLRELLIGIIESAPFQKRRGGDAR